MTSYLIQWSPTKEPDAYDWFEGGAIGGWAFAAHKAAKPGDEVFMRRSGPDRPGIVLRGRITGFTEPKPTFINGARLRPYVKFDIEQLADRCGPALVSDETLLTITDGAQQWRNQSSGVSIDPAAAKKLRSLLPPPDTDEKALRIFTAFLQIPLSPIEQRLIQVLLDNPGESSAQLTFRMGWKGKSAWHMHFGIMCKKREHLLWPAPEGFSFGKWYGAILVKWAGKASDGGTGFRLRPEAMRAFDPLGSHQ